jgi:hypothetical protein
MITVVGEFHLVVLAIPWMLLPFSIDLDLPTIIAKFNHLNLVMLVIFPWTNKRLCVHPNLLIGSEIKLQFN